MARMVFRGLEFEDFLLKTKGKLGLTWERLGELVGVSDRTLRDWGGGALLPNEEVVKKLSRLGGFEVPRPVEIREEYWSGRKYGHIGALARIKKHGPLGTPEGRRKGGIVSQQRRRENPEYYKKLGCLTRKKFSKLKLSTDLAELTGIILGDGGIASHQLKIYLNRKLDKVYADYVENLAELVFGEKGSRYDYSENGVIIICITGVNLIGRLSEIGLKKGDKMKNQVGFPEWIWESDEYKRRCVRGLIDTDGCLYFHHHWAQNRKYKYRNLGLCFTSRSKNLIESVSRVFSESKIKHSINARGENIYVYSLDMVKRYLKIFGSSNPRITNKLDYHLSRSTRLN